MQLLNMFVAKGMTKPIMEYTDGKVSLAMEHNVFVAPLFTGMLPVDPNVLFDNFATGRGYTRFRLKPMSYDQIESIFFEDKASISISHVIASPKI